LRDGPIEINRNSWHGRLTRYVFGPAHILDTPSICPYFWSVWVAVIFAPIKWIVYKVEDWGHWLQVVIGIAMLLFFIGIIFRPLETIIVMIVTIGVCVSAQVIWWVGMWYSEIHPYVHKDKPPTPTKKRAPSLLGSWLRARKDKVCPPIIEVRDE